MVAIGEPARITYTNYRGETAERTITPKRVWFGISDWHAEPQWFLTAFDQDKNADREFALIDFGYSRPSAARELALEECKDRLGDLIGHARFVELNFDIAYAHLQEAVTLYERLSSPDHADAGKVEGDGWLPIESAPNNNAILVHYDDGNIELISADDNMFSWIAYTVKEDFCTKPTHWRPLPSAPASEGAE